MFYAVGSPEPNPAAYDPEMREFNQYFYNRLLRGTAVIDNDLSHTRKMTEILKSKGLLH